MEAITYGNIMLFGFGLIGIILHNLIEMNKLNKMPEYNFTLGKYLKAEVFSILISVFVVIACVFASKEIKQLEQVGNWLGLGFVSIGYMGQSILVKFIGKAEKIIE